MRGLAQGSLGSRFPISPGSPSSSAPAPGLLPVCMAASAQTHLLGCGARAAAAVRAPPSVGSRDPEDTAALAVGPSLLSLPDAVRPVRGRPGQAPLHPPAPGELLGREEALTYLLGADGGTWGRTPLPIPGACPQGRRSPAGSAGRAPSSQTLGLVLERNSQVRTQATPQPCLTLARGAPAPWQGGREVTGWL